MRANIVVLAWHRKTARSRMKERCGNLNHFMSERKKQDGGNQKKNATRSLKRRYAR